MKTFAGIELDSIDNFNLPFLRDVKNRFQEAINAHIDTLRLGNSASDRRQLQELQKFFEPTFITILSNYQTCKRHEDTLARATILHSPVSPNLKELMELAYQHSPTEWRAQAYLKDDCDMLEEYLNSERTDLPEESVNTFVRGIAQQKNDEELLDKWQQVLRRHYLAAMRMNLQIAHLELDRVRVAGQDLQYVVNRPYVFAQQIVHLLTLFDFLSNNMGGNKDLNLMCHTTICILDQVLTSFKQLPDQPITPSCCQGGFKILAFRGHITDKDDNYVVRNFPRYRMHQQSPLFL